VPYFSIAIALAVAACGGNDPVDDKANPSARLPEPRATGPTANGEPHGKTEPAKPLPAAASTIPVALQGRCRHGLANDEYLFMEQPCPTDAPG